MIVNVNIGEKLIVSDKNIEQVNFYLWLGRIVTKNGRTEDDVMIQIRKADAFFDMLYLIRKKGTSLKRQNH